ncbi:hypothetical protein FAIPA1_120053 [Frankia sp. AiPs1]|uniref:hypothetical protein n=1 Tax=Frankia sp. AiPa1 TaxID=573492 RepID=UPI00202B53F1|nr:hypothetical protein [Frankia sp. AiPa1]MCL9758459.1 hypothetical protein [Frankia sp. AiPa1]
MSASPGRPEPPEPPEPPPGWSGPAITSAWDRRVRALTVGLVAVVTLVAFEALAVVTVLPDVAADLHGFARPSP